MAETTEKSKSIGTVLVVGGCGFLGSAVVDQLLNFPSEKSTTSSQFATLASRYPSYNQTATTIHALDLKCERNRWPGATYHEADITNASQLLEIFKKVQPDVVINTASPSWEAPPAVLRKVNIAGTQTLLDVAGGKHGSWSTDKARKCKAFVHTSSSSVVSDGQSDLRNADERWPYVCPNPREYYSETKVHAERIVLNHNNLADYGNMLTCAVRPAGIIGEGDMGGFTYHITKNAATASNFTLHTQIGDGNNLFDNTYVHNVVYGLLCAADGLLATYKLQHEKGGISNVLDMERVDGEAFNVTNDEPASFWDTTRFIYSLYGCDIDRTKIRAIPLSLMSVVGIIGELVDVVTGTKGRLNRQTFKYTVINRYYSCEKLKRRTGYEPRVSIEEGLRRGVDWYKTWEKEQKAGVSGPKK